MNYLMFNYKANIHGSDDQYHGAVSCLVNRISDGVGRLSASIVSTRTLSCRARKDIAPP